MWRVISHSASKFLIRNVHMLPPEELKCKKPKSGRV